MAFLNPSFELAGVKEGCPSGWVFSAHGQHAFAAYGADEHAWETFEDGWDNDDYLFELVGIDAVAAEYQTLSPGAKGYEDFEEFWNTNHLYVYGLAGVFATYDAAPQDFEDFEQEWDSNQSYLYNFAGTAAAFDGTPENFEDFEEDWNSNQSYVYNFSGTAAVYDTGLGEAFEDFEEEWSAIASIP